MAVMIRYTVVPTTCGQVEVGGQSRRSALATASVIRASVKSRSLMCLSKRGRYRRKRSSTSRAWAMPLPSSKWSSSQYSNLGLLRAK